MLDPKQRHKLLLADRTGDVAWITAAIERLLAADPGVELIDCEAAFREAAAQSYLIACQDKFEVVVGMKNWIAALDRLGRTPEANRQMLAER
jgi:hypothetical protein